MEEGLSKYETEQLILNKSFVEYFNECLKLNVKSLKILWNFLLGDISAYINKEMLTLNDLKFTKQNLVDLVNLLSDSKINSKQAKEVFECMIEEGKEPNTIVKEKGMMQITDDAAIHDVVMEVLKENDEQAREYNPEKTRMIDFFVGQVMKKTRGKANPAKTMEMLREELAKYNK